MSWQRPQDTTPRGNNGAPRNGVNRHNHEKRFQRVSALRNVRFGSKADMCAAISHVRFTPNSDRKSGHGAEAYGREIPAP
jgi:hypothetical protein